MPYPDLDLFDTQEEAIAKAKVLGCYFDDSSFHKENYEGEEFFMPCKTHQEYDGWNTIRTTIRTY